MIVIDNTEVFIEEAFRENSVAIVAESSQYFIPYLDVMFHSMFSCINPKYNYDLIVLGNEIDPYDEQIIKKTYSAYPNVSIRFFNPQQIVKKYVDAAKNKYLNINYYRLALPWILSKYDKAVQLGADIVIKRDIAEIYNTVLQDDEYLAGCRDLGYLGRLNMDIPKEELGLRNPLNYVNADVLVYNLKGIRQAYYIDDVMQLWQTYRFRCSEQDALNLLFDGNIKILDGRWNVFPTKMVSEMHIACSPEDLQAQRQQDLQDPYIVHYAAIPKPWEYPMIGEGLTWWTFAKQSIYYEEIIRRLMIYTIKCETASAHVSVQKRTELLLFPLGSNRRSIAKKIMPRDSALWNFAKAVKHGFVKMINFFRGKNREEKYGKLGSN